MACSFESLGYSLSPVQTRDGTAVCRLETPFTLAGAFPLELFVEETPEGCHVFDEGLTYFNLLALGLDDGNGWLAAAVRAVVEKESGVTFSDQGVLEASGPLEEAPRLVTRCIASLIRLDQWVLSVLDQRQSGGQRNDGRPLEKVQNLSRVNHAH